MSMSAAVAGAVPKAALAGLIRRAYPRVEPELARLADYAPRGGTAVDVGGWFGPWTRGLTRLADHMVTVEASPELAEILRRAFPAAAIVQAAASDQLGETDLWVPPQGVFAGTSSVTASDAAVPVRVPTITLDSLALEDVRFVKMDIEGHELPALRGAEETIRRDRPLLLLELETRHQPLEPVVELLTSWGYEGQVMPGETWIPLDDFDLAAHQREAVGKVQQSLARRVLRPYPRYVNSVLFRQGHG